MLEQARVGLQHRQAVAGRQARDRRHEPEFGEQAPRRRLRLLGADREAVPRRGERRQRLPYPVEDHDTADGIGGVDLPEPPALGLRPARWNAPGRGQHPVHERLDAVPDEAAHPRLRERRPAELGQERIGGGGQRGGAVHQGAVEVEDDPEPHAQPRLTRPST
jgi:hypothetical protein